MNRCPTCQQPLLPDDTACWQCGTAVTPPEEVEEPPAPPVRSSWLATDGGGSLPLVRSPVATTIYSVMTASLLVIFLLVVNRLQSAPLSQVSFGDTIPVGYQVVTDSGLQVSFDIPQNWRAFDPLRPADRPTLEQFLENHELILEEATQPWGALAGDLELLLLTLPDETWQPGQSSFVVVVRSQALANMTPEAVMLMPEQAPWLTLRQISYIEDNDKSHVSVDLVTYPLDEERQANFSGFVYLCSQQLVSRSEAALLLAICQPQSATQTPLQGRNARAMRENVLESFEFLK